MSAIFDFTPNEAFAGQTVRISGNNLAGVTSVKFGNSPYTDAINSAGFTIIDNNYIDVIVPQNVVGVGIQVSGDPTGTGSKNGFSFLGNSPVPSISSFSPIAQVPGHPVTIYGSGFSSASSVKFGAEDALYFVAVSDGVIRAWPNMLGDSLVTVTNPSGSVSKPGFTSLKSRVQITDLPPLGRDANSDDIVYVFDKIREILCQATVEQLPAGSGGGGGGGDDGNVYTALGSPFKVRVGDVNYSYDEDTNTVTIQDVRLLGKSDYVVISTDVNAEFENYDPETDTGHIEYDEEAGSVIIHNYQLTEGRHITIYADGVTTTAMQTYLLSVKSQIDGYEAMLSPIKLKGVVFPWRKPANLIPSGWQEATDLRGKTLIGQDPTDVYDEEENPDGLSQGIGVTVGRKMLTLLKDWLPSITLKIWQDRKAGTNGVNVLSASDVQIPPYPQKTFELGGNSTPFSILPPAKIVQWIEYVG